MPWIIAVAVLALALCHPHKPKPGVAEPTKPPVVSIWNVSQPGVIR